MRRTFRSCLWGGEHAKGPFRSENNRWNLNPHGRREKGQVEKRNPPLYSSEGKKTGLYFFGEAGLHRN